MLGGLMTYLIINPKAMSLVSFRNKKNPIAAKSSKEIGLSYIHCWYNLVMMKWKFRQQQRTLHLVERQWKVPILFHIANNGLELVFWLVETWQQLYWQSALDDHRTEVDKVFSWDTWLAGRFKNKVWGYVQVEIGLVRLEKGWKQK